MLMHSGAQGAGPMAQRSDLKLWGGPFGAGALWARPNGPGPKGAPVDLSCRPYTMACHSTTLCIKQHAEPIGTYGKAMGHWTGPWDIGQGHST